MKFVLANDCVKISIQLFFVFFCLSQDEFLQESVSQLLDFWNNCDRVMNTSLYTSKACLIV